MVKVRVVSNLPKATLVTIEPLTEDDWELNSELAESVILKQVEVVHEQMRFPLWLHGQTIVMLLVLSTFPQNPVVQLVPGTEVAVAPKRRKNSSQQSPDEGHTVAKAQLLVQDSDNRFIYKYEENGIEMDIIFTSGVFVHPETAKKYCFTSHQLVEISPRPQLKNSKKKLHSRSKSNEKETNKGKHTDKGYFPHHVIVHMLLCESVSEGTHNASSVSSPVFGAELHSWLTSLLSPTSGMLVSIYNLPLPGHILICGLAGSGKTSLAKAPAKYIEGSKDILAHVVFVSFSRLTLEKPSTIRQMLSSNISEALDHAPSVIILDDLDSLVASSSDLEGSQPSIIFCSTH